MAAVNPLNHTAHLRTCEQLERGAAGGLGLLVRNILAGSGSLTRENESSQ